MSRVILALILLAGLALVAIGLWWVYPPAALVAVGGCMMVHAVRHARRS